MLTYLLMLMTRRWRVAFIALLAVLVVPTLALAVSMSQVIEMFKYSYGTDELVYLASIETVLYNLLKRKKKQVTGRGQWIIPIKTQNAGVFLGMPEGGALTTKRAQPDTMEALFSLVEFQAVWDVSWKMLRQAAKTSAAFETAMNFMDDAIKKRIFRVINMQLLSYRGVGELAILPGADNQTTVSVNSLPGMDQGMIVDLMDASDDTTKLGTAGSTVSSVSVATREVTISAAAAGTAAGDYFVVADQVAGGVSYSLLGMGAWLNSANPAATKGNIGGVDRTVGANFPMQGNIMSNGGTLRAFTEDLLIDGENLVRESGGTQPDRYMANGNILKRYHGEAVKDRYFALNKGPQSVGAGGEKVGFGREGMDLDNTANGTGTTPYVISGKPVHEDPYMPANRIYGWADNHFFIGHDGIEVPTPLSEVFDDMVSYFTMTTSAKFDVWHYWEAELLCDNPKAGIQFADIAES